MIHETTGINFTIFYDAFDRARFFNGFITSIRLMAVHSSNSRMQRLLRTSGGWPNSNLWLGLHRPGLSHALRERSLQ